MSIKHANTQERLKDRNVTYQQSIDAEFLLKSRENFSVELRKSKRLNSACKRRAIWVDESVGETPRSLITICPYLENHEITHRTKLDYLLQILKSRETLEIIQFALIETKKILAQNSSTYDYLSDALELGFSPILISFLDPSFPPTIVSESAWCLCNLSFEKHE